MAKKKKKKKKMRGPSTRRRKLTQEEWEAQSRIPWPDAIKEDSSGSLKSIDLRGHKMVAKPYEGGAPGLRSQNKS
ncbi:hypothetical protein G6L94_16595 [Agrobacterium rhizogenes]|uniref:hypothetical protein n=1 Tax=Rhizobium rhizogenes TaxID=359 RepID=UPI00080F8942|nr:hypothetical protein [Rhizobium rhizogenes]OCJ22111.1 hypothetical protein A6U89_33195 [Agrobacterium sp. B133/95]NTH13564.1 hypothetical protein [Rhizobium rhizogenes]NTI49941.1 hypothetical protein [Rhizobium rhizogenes]NTI95312.1 hypothetical protein [Rhizobium rhizogenes]NTJ57780.1 hypothetical protein [Rhizobium rhizogenes]